MVRVKRNTLLILVLIIAGIFVAANWQNLALTIAGTGSTWGVKPVWSHVTCDRQREVNFGGAGSIETIVPREGTSLRCDYFTDKCFYQVKMDKESTWFTGTGKIKYYICGANDQICGRALYVGGDGYQPRDTWMTIPEVITPSQRIWIEMDNAFMYSITGLARPSYTMWGLTYSWENKEERVEGNCDLGNMLSSAFNSRAYQDKGITKLYLNELKEGTGYLNYISSYSFGPAEANVFAHPTYGEVWCEAGGYIYSVSTVKTADDKTYKIRNRDYVDNTNNKYVTVGTSLPREECCPGEAFGDYSCNDNFKKVLTGAQCTRDSECDAGGQSYCISSQSITHQTCNQNTHKCEASIPQTVECCMSQDCTKIGKPDYVCSPQFICVKQAGPSVCGDGICSKDEVGICKAPECTQGGGGDFKVPVWAWLVGAFLVLLVIILLFRRRR